MKRLKVTIWDNDYPEDSPIETKEELISMHGGAMILSIPVFHLRDGIVTVTVDDVEATE